MVSALGREYKFHKDLLLLHEDDEFIVLVLSCSPHFFDMNSPAILTQRNSESLLPTVDSLDHYVFLIIDLNVSLFIVNTLY